MIYRRVNELSKKLHDAGPRPTRSGEGWRRGKRVQARPSFVPARRACPTGAGWHGQSESLPEAATRMTMWHSRPRLWVSRPPQIPPSRGRLDHISCSHADSMRSVCARTSARRIAISRGKMKKIRPLACVGPAGPCRDRPRGATRPSARFARANGTAGGKGRRALFPRAEALGGRSQCATSAASEPSPLKGEGRVRVTYRGGARRRAPVRCRAVSPHPPASARRADAGDLSQRERS